MSHGFEQHCAKYGVSPEDHHTRSKQTPDVVPQPLGDPVRTGASLIHGLGVMTTRPIEACTVVGTALDHKHNRTCTIGRYINHSDWPNCALVAGEGITMLVALEDLEDDEECTIDYESVMQIGKKINDDARD
jgi:hypothetical protein